MILKTLALGPFMSNCYIVGSEKTGEGIVIDPGADPDTVLHALKGLNLEAKLIVSTHGHIDHVGAVKQVKEKTGAPFAMHAGDLKDKATQETARQFAASMGMYVDKTPAPDRLLQDGDIVTVGDMHFKVLHIPGHSPGSIALAGHGIVFSGDVLFQYSIGRTDFPGGSYPLLMEGIMAKLMTLPDETVVYSGHGFKTTIGAERKKNPFVQEWIAHSPHRGA